MRVREWIKDRAVRKIAKFGVPVAIGQFTASASGLVTLSLLARHLGADALGVIALLRTLVAMVESFANFNTWLAIVKYGTEASAQHRTDDFKRVLKLAFSIDLATAITGACVASILAFALGDQFGWTWHESCLCALYSLTLVAKAGGTSDGIYRVCDAYRLQAIVSSAMAFVMTMFVLIAVVANAGFDGCVFAMIAGEIVSNVVVNLAAFWVARDRGHGGWWRISVRGVQMAFPGIIRFVLTTNAQITLRTAQAELDMLLVGTAIGKAAAGLFRVIKQVSRIPLRITSPFEQVLFTELARCIAKRDAAGFRQLLTRFVIIAGGVAFLVWLAVAALANQILHTIGGSEFVIAASAFRWYLLAMVLHVMGAPLMRAVIALGRPGTLLVLDIFSVGVLLVFCLIGAHFYGLVGICAGAVLQRGLQMIWLGLAVSHFLSNSSGRPETTTG